MRRFGLIGFLILLCGLVLPVAQAQDCDTFALSTELRDYARRMEDTSSIERLLNELEQWTADVRASCVPRDTDTGLKARPDPDALFTYTSEEFGSEASLGPVYMPGGLYRVHLDATGPISGKLETVEGSCYLLSIFDLFAIFEEGEQNSIERVIYADGCEARINVEGATGEWNIVVGEYQDDDMVAVQDLYTSDEYGTMPALGPIQFEDGTYEFTLTTTGFMILSVQPLAGDCLTEVDGRFISVRANEATGGVIATLETAYDCIAFITTDNVTEPWELKVTKVK